MSQPNNPIEALRARLEIGLEYGGKPRLGEFNWQVVVEDAIRMAEIYRDIAEEWRCALDPVRLSTRTTDQEAHRLFEEKKS